MIDHNRIIENNALAAVYCRNSNSPLKNNLIVDNHAVGLYCVSNSNPQVVNCVICNNDFNNYTVYCSGSAPILTNSICWANSRPMSDGVIARYSDIQGGWPGEGNIDVNPQFLDAATLDYNICAQSPCLNAGDPDLLDPDSTRSDIGLYFPNHPQCTPGDAWYVSPTGDDSTGDGSIGNPFLTACKGIAAASSGDSVILMNGTYHENLRLIGKSIVLGSFFMSSHDTLDIQRTILDGDSVATTISLGYIEETATVVGLTIMHGYSSLGGAIYCGYSDVIILNNLITNNYSGFDGGGIYCRNSINTTIQGNSISNNSSSYSGGGIAFMYGTAQIRNNNIIENKSRNGAGIATYSTDVTITGNFVDSDSATEWGGGIYCSGGRGLISENNIMYNNGGTGGGIYLASGDVTLSNNIISGNIAENGGGIFSSSSTSISHNIIEANSSSGYGGGIELLRGTPTIYGNSIRNNTALVGGGISAFDSSPIIISNVVSNNTSEGDGGAISFSHTSNCSVNNNTFLENIARKGGAISWESAYGTISNNTIFNNNASERGGAIYAFNHSVLSVENTIMWSDSAGIHSEIDIDSSSSAAVVYNDIQGNYPGWGNIDMDPRFRNPSGGDYHLAAISCGDTTDSPCIDAGHPAFADSLLDCSWGLGTSRSDIGAYGGGDTLPFPGGIIHIPDDFPRIQMGIAAGHDDDTILVEPGTYNENIDFLGKRIVVCSQYLMSGDTSFISSTIINGDSTRTVVSFVNSEDSAAAIVGFTIKSGGFFNRGYGGIYCLNSSPSIRANFIKQINSITGGIFCDTASPVIENNRIQENRSYSYGGGIYCRASSPTIRGNIIRGCLANY